MFIEILFKILLFKGGVLIYAEHCMYPSVEALSETWYLNRSSHSLSACAVLQCERQRKSAEDVSPRAVKWPV